MSQKPIRLDDLMVARGLATDRTQAAAMIMAGLVFGAGFRYEKPGAYIPQDAVVSLKKKSRFASRAGDKLFEGLSELGLDEPFRDRVVLDVGASTGGFTDCALQLGARQVIALDVGKNQLAWKLRTDPRVSVMEGTDIRNFKCDKDLEVDWVLADISFNSLQRLAAPIIEAVEKQSCQLLLLVKPQFELARHEVEAGGVVDDDHLRQEAVNRVIRVLETLGVQVIATCDSPVPGRSGNREIFIYGRLDNV